MPKFVEIRDTVTSKVLTRNTATARELMGSRTEPGRYVPVDRKVRLIPIVHEPAEEELSDRVEARMMVEAEAAREVAQPEAPKTQRPKPDRSKQLAAMRAANVAKRARQRADREAAAAVDGST